MSSDPRDDAPDPLLIEAAYAGRLWLSDLSPAEREYVVAALTRRGDSADLIAGRLHCGKRVVQKLRAAARRTA